MRVLAPGAYSAVGSAAMSSSSLPASTKRLEVRTVRSCAVRMAEVSALLAGGEVEHGGDAVVGVEAEQRDEEADRVGQQHADVLAAARQLREPAAQHQAGQRQPPIGERRAVGVLEDDLVAAVLGRSFDEAGKERGAGAGGIECLRHRNDAFGRLARVWSRCSGWGAPRNRRSHLASAQWSARGALCAAAKIAEKCSRPNGRS